jgi:hypothetical protein
MGRKSAVEVNELPPAFVTGPESFSRAPMTFDGIVMQPGVSGFRAPSPDKPWLELRLQDGCWIRVRPVDDLLLTYQIVPFGSLSLLAGIREEYLAVWAAFIRLSRLATNALERAVGGELSSEVARALTEADETGSYTPVPRVDFRPSGTKLLDSYSRQIGLGGSHEVSVAGRFGRTG